MKKASILLCIIFSFSLCIVTISAADTGYVTGNGVRLRSSANTTSTILKTLNEGAKLTILKSVSSSDVKACSKWYQATYSTTTGYICADYVRIDNGSTSTPAPEVTASYEKELAKFPSSYQTKIKALHKIYPNAIFTPFNTKVSWNTMLNAEYTTNGRSLIQGDDGYKSTDSWAYNYKTNVFKEFSGSKWHAANKQTIQYYMDPRNFITETNVFMFDYLSYDANVHTKAGLEKLLAGTFMATKKVDNKKSYVDTIMEIAKSTKVSPYFIAARIRQEQGAGTSPLISGTYSGYKGYYNYFNINASGSTDSVVITNGLKYAKSQGWNTQYKSIEGGVKMIAKSYINIGQNTNYLQKWDVFGPQYGAHQYMQNIVAPVSEAATTLKSYKAMDNYKNLNYVFAIPVFDSMPSSTSLPKKGNPNNYLSKLTVNGSSVPSFDGAKTSYTMTLPKGTTSVEIGAAKVYSGATISGIGKVNLTSDSQKINVKVTAKNGAVRTYAITINRSNTGVDINQIVNAAGFTNDGTYIGGLTVGMTANTFKSKISAKGGSATVKSSSNETKTGAIIATGDKVTITSGGKTKTYTLVIYGDASGDGKIAANDYVRIKNHIMGSKKLTGANKEAADVNKDGKVLASDYVKIKNHIMGTSHIKQ